MIIMKVFRNLNWQLEGFAVSSFDYGPRGVAGTAGILNDTVKVRAAGQVANLNSLTGRLAQALPVARVAPPRPAGQPTGNCTAPQCHHDDSLANCHLISLRRPVAGRSRTTRRGITCITGRPQALAGQ